MIQVIQVVQLIQVIKVIQVVQVVWVVQVVRVARNTSLDPEIVNVQKRCDENFYFALLKK